MLEELLDYKHIRMLLELLGNHGSHRLIGGCVRDSLLGLKLKDVDIATTLTPTEIETTLAKHKIKTINIGKEFGTIIAVIEQQQYEITTLRRDVEFYDGRHAKVEFTDNWQIDAARRDLTFNALSYCPHTNQLYDYFQGYNDLKQGIVRLIGNADARIKEDFLRILRVFRFYTYYGKEFAEGTIEACTDNATQLFLISAERKFQELDKIIAHPNGHKTLELMHDLGVLEQIFQKKLVASTFSFIERHQNLCMSLEHPQKSQLIWGIIAYHNDIASKQLQSQFKLPNKTLRYLNRLKDCLAEIERFGFIEQFYQYKLAYEWQEILLDALTILFSKDQSTNHQSIFASMRKMIKTLLSYPLNGHDIISSFKLSDNDKKIGDLLQIGKDYWYSTKYKAEKEDIIEYIRQHLQ